MFIKKRNKKAFTMIELLVCLVCLGFLTIAIATFASSIKTQQSKMFEREATMVNEYQDILDLKSKGLNIVDQLNYKFYLTQALPQETGSEFSIIDMLNINSLQKVECVSMDENILFIDDEVAMGFYRTGKLFAYEHANIVPDIICVAKGITAGYLPLSATITNDKIYEYLLAEQKEKDIKTSTPLDV